MKGSHKRFGHLHLKIFSFVQSIALQLAHDVPGPIQTIQTPSSGPSTDRSQGRAQPFRRVFSSYSRLLSYSDSFPGCHATVDVAISGKYQTQPSPPFHAWRRVNLDLCCCVGMEPIKARISSAYTGEARAVNTSPRGHLRCLRQIHFV